MMLKSAVTDPAHSLDALQHALADGGVRRLVSRTVRRGVPVAEAEDVAQAVFCDALDATSVPDNPVEIPFWLIGIARNRVVDFFRRGPREVASDDAADTLSAEPCPFELREVVHRMASRCDQEQKRTLSWMVLERDGVPFRTIARDEGLSATAVRARVYRLRRLLRREFAGVLTVLLVAVSAGALAHRWPSRRPALAESGSVAAGLPAWATGEFEVATLEPAADVDAATRMLLQAATHATRVSIHGGRLEVRTPTAAFARSLSAEPLGETDLRVTLDDPSGGSQTLHVTLAGDGQLVVESFAGHLRGTLTLRSTDPTRR